MTPRGKAKDKTMSTNVLKIYFFILILWTIYRISFRLPEWFDEFIAKPLLWLLPIFFLHNKILSIKAKSPKISASYNILLGLFVGLLFFCLYTLFSTIQFGPPILNPDHLSLPIILMQLSIACTTGFIEELVFRRYIFEELLLICDHWVIANIYTAFLFACIHLPLTIFVYHYSLPATLSYISLLVISGFIYGAVYMHKKSLVASSTTHAVWNFLGTIIR